MTLGVFLSKQFMKATICPSQASETCPDVNNIEACSQLLEIVPALGWPSDITCVKAEEVRWEYAYLVNINTLPTCGSCIQHQRQPAALMPDLLCSRSAALASLLTCAIWAAHGILRTLP